jgi:hypothetical protein
MSHLPGHHDESPPPPPRIDWLTLILGYACPECGARQGESCVTVYELRGRRAKSRNPDRSKLPDLGRPTQPHRARRQLMIKDHLPEWAS